MKMCRAITVAYTYLELLRVKCHGLQCIVFWKKNLLWLLLLLEWLCICVHSGSTYITQRHCMRWLSESQLQMSKMQYFIRYVRISAVHARCMVYDAKQFIYLLRNIHMDRNSTFVSIFYTHFIYRSCKFTALTTISAFVVRAHLHSFVRCEKFCIVAMSAVNRTVRKRDAINAVGRGAILRWRAKMKWVWQRPNGGH